MPLLLWRFPPSHCSSGTWQLVTAQGNHGGRDSLAGSSSQRHLHLAQWHRKLGMLVSPAGFPTGTWFQLGHTTYASVSQKQPGANTPMHSKHTENR